MVCKYFLILLCATISIGYASSGSELDDAAPSSSASLESVLHNIRRSFSLADSEFPEVALNPAGRVFDKIEGLDFLYFQAKQGIKRALPTLEKEASKSAYACALMLKYCKHRATDKVAHYTSIFFSHFRDRPITLVKFEAIADHLLNLALALYHQKMRKNLAMAEQYAQAAVNQGCIEGYNVIGSLHKKTDTSKATQAYLKAASLDNAKGIYKLARLVSTEDSRTSRNLYEQAAKMGYIKAYFVLTGKVGRERLQDKFLDYFRYLISINTALCFRMVEQNNDWARVAIYIAKEMQTTQHHLLPPLLKAIYKNNSHKNKLSTIAHLLAMGYRFGRYNIPQSLEEAYQWLSISAIRHGNLADGYQLCCMSAADPEKKSHMEAINVGRQIVTTPTLLERFGMTPQILLARLLIDEAENQHNPALLEEAWYWLLDACNNMEIDLSRRKRFVWQIPGTNRVGHFSVVEEAFEKSISTALIPFERNQAIVELAFHNLWGGIEGIKSLVKARSCFFQASGTLSDKSYFFVSVINHYLSSQHLMHGLPEFLDVGLVDFCQSVEKIRITKARKVYGEVVHLLDRYLDLSGDERNLLKKKIRELSFTNLEEAAISMSAWFYYGMHGLNPSLEHSIHWLKYAAFKENKDALQVLKTKYPLSLPLTDAEKATLHLSRTHTNDLPNMVVVGDGLSGLTTALSFAKAAREGKIGIGKITVVGRRKKSLSEASVMVSRQHRGGEYAKDQRTARQCLFGAAIWQQVYHTERMLTDLRVNDFLLAKASKALASGDDALSKEMLMERYGFLNELYKEYLSQMVASGKYDAVSAADALFGPTPIFREIAESELSDLGLSHRFAAGISTSERGFNPVGIGTVLEFLLRQYNVEVINDYEVTDIEKLPNGGFKIKGKDREPIYGHYNIIAAWHNNSKLSSALNKDSFALTASSSEAVSAKRVFLRSLLLVDVSLCDLPKGRSFFGLVGEHGGMVSFFNKRVASIFIPREGLSYHGEYNLDEKGVNALPGAATRKLEQINQEKREIAKRILADAQAKYPFLKSATVIDLFTQTTISENLDEVCKRTHSNAKWVENAEGCLEACSTKATFAPFQALQALARFVIDKPGGLATNFTPEEIAFLDSLIHPDMFKEGIVENVVLPDHFKMILDDTFMTEAQFTAAMRRYAFERGLTFGLFEKEDAAAAAGKNPAEQLKFVGQEEGITSIDLEHLEFDDPLQTSLFSLLDKPDIALTQIKLGHLSKEINDDEEDSLGASALNRLQGNIHLENLALSGWNLTFKARHMPLGTLLPQLQELHLKNVTLTLPSVRALFGSSTTFMKLKHFSVVNSNPKLSVLALLMENLEKCQNLESLNLNGNEIGKESPDETIRVLEKFVRASSNLKSLFLHNNRIFDSINLDGLDSLPLEVDANPFLLAMTYHPIIEKVSIIGNGPISDILQNRLDSLFLRKKGFH